MQKKEVCWNITTRCNQGCKYCHRFLGINDLCYEENERILDNLIKDGITDITWTGGKALLYPNLNSLLKKAKENGINNKLITNGMLLAQNDEIKEICNYLDSLTLSIDSTDNEINAELGRGVNHYNNINTILEYVKDKEKTTQKADSLEAAIDYAMNRTKTEQAVFEDTIGCTNENAYEDMLATKKRFHKMGGVEGYHLVQSFAEGEVTPELAHLIGQELADRLLKGQFEVVITTHLNTRHYHNHIVWNSVSMVDGHKYHSNAKSYYTEIRKISDDLCRKYGLSIIESNQKKSIPYVQWKAEQEGKPTWRMAIRLDIRESVQESYSWSQFLKEMEKRGYTWKLNRKYISLKAPGMERYIRLRSLGKNYSEEEIRGQILQPKVKRVYQKAVQIHPKKKLTGIQALYYSYLYQMGVLPKRPKRSPYAVREDIRKLDRRIEQIEFLLKHDIITREQLAAYREPLQKQIAELMKERRRLYRNGGRETGEERLSEINEELKRLRKEVRMTVQIEKHSLEIEARLQEAEEQSQNEKRVEDKERMQKSQEVR